MASTEATVRTAHANAIISIGASSLGFDVAADAVREYLIEYELPEKWSAYLQANVGNAKVTRRWGLHVDTSEQIIASASTGNTFNFEMDRRYAVRHVALYALGVSGAGIALVQEHARKIRAAVYALGSRLGGIVDSYDGVSDLRISVGEYPDVGRVVRAEQVFQYRAGCTSADF